MLCCLETLGYIIKDEATKRYSLSLKLYQVATYHPPIRSLRLLARTALQDLSLKIAESCHLGVIDGNDLVIVDQVSGPERIRIAFKLGARFDPLETSSGKLLLSEYPEPQRERLLEVSGIWKAANKAQRKAILEELASRPRERVWEGHSSLREGIYDIAVALGTPETIHATLAVAHIAGRKNRTSVEEIRKQVIESARRIEAQLGPV